MGRIRRGGYILTSWKGDPHPPCHFHVVNNKGEFLGRITAEKKPLGHWNPPRKLLDVIDALKSEGRI